MSSQERVGGGIAANLDLLAALRRAEETGDVELAAALRTDLYQMIDSGNATTYFEIAVGEYEFPEDHPDFQLVRRVAESCAISGMFHARQEAANREREARAYVPTDAESEILKLRFGDDIPTLTKEEVDIGIQMYGCGYGNAVSSSDKGTPAERDRVLRQVMSELLSTEKKK